MLLGFQLGTRSADLAYRMHVVLLRNTVQSVSLDPTCNKYSDMIAFIKNLVFSINE
jgi:hypothetical protein